MAFSTGSGSLSCYVKRGEIFTRSAPNTFSLAELNQVGMPADEPPANFGALPADEGARGQFQIVSCDTRRTRHLLAFG